MSDAWSELEEQLGQGMTRKLATVLRDSPAYRQKVEQYIGTPCLYCGGVFTTAFEVERAVTAPRGTFMFLAHRSCHPVTA